MQLCEFILSLFEVILIENKEESLVRAQSRTAEIGLKNIGFIQANMDYFTGPFHIGVRIHYKQHYTKNVPLNQFCFHLFLMVCL